MNKTIISDIKRIEYILDVNGVKTESYNSDFIYAQIGKNQWAKIQYFKFTSGEKFWSVASVKSMSTGHVCKGIMTKLRASRKLKKFLTF